MNLFFSCITRILQRIPPVLPALGLALLIWAPPLQAGNTVTSAQVNGASSTTVAPGATITVTVTIVLFLFTSTGIFVIPRNGLG